MKKMKRRQLFLSSAQAGLATMFGSSWLFKQTKAQTPGPGETLGAYESV